MQVDEWTNFEFEVVRALVKVADWVSQPGTSAIVLLTQFYKLLSRDENIVFRMSLG